MLATLAAFWPSWISMAEIWWHTTTFHHGFLIAPIALLLVWRLRPRLIGLRPRQEPLGLAALAACAGLWLLGEAAQAQLLQHLAVVAMLVALTVALLGREITKRLAFPLLFLFFMVPFGEGLVPHLQDVTARMAVALLRLVGVPVFHDGVLIETPSGLFEVAEACAGIRFLIANLVVVALFAHLALRRPWKWLLFLALGVTVPILANGFRAFGIIWVAYLTDNAYAAGVDHVVYGWGFFTAIMLLLLLIGRWLSDEPYPASLKEPTLPAVPAGAAAWSFTFALLVLALVAAGPAYARLVMRAPPVPSVTMALPALSVHAPWQRADMADQLWEPEVIGTDLDLQQTYLRQPDGRRVDLHLAYYAFERQGAEAVNQGNRQADGKRWLRAASGRATLTAPGLPPEVFLERLAAPNGREQRLVLWWYWVDGTFTADPLRAKLLQVRSRLLGHTPPAAIVAFSTTLTDGDVNEARSAIDGLLVSGGMDPAAYLASIAVQGS
jgi:exosortase A